MRLFKRLASFLALTALLGLVGCSSITLAYKQFPLLGGLWADNYLDLDSEQTDRLKAQIRSWRAWRSRAVQRGSSSRRCQACQLRIWALRRSVCSLSR
jgi:hypothetical protein